MKTLTRLCLLLAALTGAGCATLAPAPKGETVHRNVHFVTRGAKRLYLDLYLPTANFKRPVPLVMWMHGGGWAFGEKGISLFVRDLTKEGFAVASVDYRLSSAARHPAQVDDCSEALRWLRAHGEKYGYDGKRVYLSGASAGAQLAALLALHDGQSRVRAAFLMYPPTDLDGFGNQGATFGLLPWFLGGPVTKFHAEARAASPINHVHRGAPPFLIIHGAKDTLVPVSHSENFHAKLRASGVSSKLVVAPNAKHGFALTEPELHEVAKFFRAHP